MLREIFYAILGRWGRAAVEWALDNPAVVTLFFAIWLLLWVAGKLQLGRIHDRTNDFALEYARKALEGDSRLSIQDLYDHMYPGWSEMLRRTALFIPHRWELWPVPATPRRVQDQIGFTPEWLATHLKDHGIIIREVKSTSKK